MGEIMKGWKAGGNLHVHHTDYTRVGREQFADLMVICMDCHVRLHRFVDKMASKGHGRTAILKRLKPYCVRKITRLHESCDFLSPVRNLTADRKCK